ncbi:hypothetical protein [Vibrio hangzhouensis]|uniref:ABM domain-containing protein n=1 Tax=Vibrio hangzhouensis TaxID=462991 RepID=A0A1H5ZP12_9VIBR|nr:hypothetical protein [Vibrio hangzhouensis]SEG38248.1 hypothetical protein SAMN04488244_112111 [Vibrio hangzhouensis]
MNTKKAANCLEIVSYKSIVSVEAMIPVNQQMQTFLHQQPGFVRRELAHEQQSWTDLVWWQDLESAKAAAEALMSQPFAETLMANVDPESIHMQHKQLCRL